MAESQFQPGAPAGFVAESGFRGFEQGQSMMARAQQMQQAEEMHQMRKQQFAEEVAMAPLRAAAMRTQLASARFQYQSALDMQKYDQQIAGLVPQAENEFNQLMLITDPEAKANAALAFSGKYAQLKNTKKWGQQFEAYDQIATRLFSENSAISRIKAQGGIREELLRQKGEFDKQLAEQKGQAALAIAELKSAGKSGATQTKFDEARGTKAAEYYDTQQSKVAEHVRTLDTIKSARSELARGIKQGLGEELKMDAAQIFNSVTRVAGIPDIFDTANKEVLRRNYSDMTLAAAARMKSQGQITESERKLLTNTVASFKNSAKAAEYIMDYMEAVAQREIEKGRFLKQKVDQAGFVDQSAEAEFYDSNPLSFYIPVSAEEAASADKIDAILKKYEKPEAK